jgi:hypothetical protein
MNQDRVTRRAFLLALTIAVAGLAVAGAHAADDCLEPLRANAGWSCHAEASNGQAVDYCLERTNTFGADPASRFFKLIATGPYSSYCSCGAKGKLPGAAFGEDKSYLCLYPDTDSVVSGKITSRRIAGQTFSAAYDLRTVFSCEPDPACDVPPVVDRDLPASGGYYDLIPGSQLHIPAAGGGNVDIAYLAGCAGYAREAPDAVFDVEPGPPGYLDFTLPDGGEGDSEHASLLVLTPSGAAHCFNYTKSFPLERGSYAVWVTLPTPGVGTDRSVRGAYFTQ